MISRVSGPAKKKKRKSHKVLNAFPTTSQQQFPDHPKLGSKLTLMQKDSSTAGGYPDGNQLITIARVRERGGGQSINWRRASRTLEAPLRLVHIRAIEHSLNILCITGLIEYFYTPSKLYHKLSLGLNIGSEEVHFISVPRRLVYSVRGRYVYLRGVASMPLWLL